MKKLILASIVAISILFLSGCQSVTRNMGGSTTIKLDPGLKLEEITWKDDNLWYLTRPMRDDEKAETHTFQESSNIGIIEGTVTIIEQDIE